MTAICTIKISSGLYIGIAFASSDNIAQHVGHCLTLEVIIRFLNVKVVAGYVLVGRVVRPGHAGVFNNFFGTSTAAEERDFRELRLLSDGPLR